MHPNRLLLFHQMCFLLLPGCCCARCVCTSRCQCTLRVLQSSSSSSSSKPTLISIPLTLPTIRNPHLTEFFLFPVYKATLYPSRRLLLLLLPPLPSSLTNPVAPCATSEIIICSIWKVSFQTQCASSTRHIHSDTRRRCSISTTIHDYSLLCTLSRGLLSLLLLRWVHARCALGSKRVGIVPF